MAIEIVIVDPDDSPSGHGAQIRSEILIGAEQDISDKIEIYTGGFYAGMQHAHDIGAFLVVRSYTGLTSTIQEALSHKDHFILLMPLGSNLSQELSLPTSLPPILSSGAGDSLNRTGYGEGLWCWDTELSGGLSTWESSYSNGRIAGKLWKIITTLSLQNDLWQAWDRAMKSTGLSWNKNNGYGKIVTADAISYAGAISSYPFPLGSVPLLLGNNSGLTASLSWAAVANAARYIVEKNVGAGWVEVSSQTGTSASIAMVSGVETQFRIKATQDEDQTEYSNIITLSYTTPPTPPENSMGTKRYNNNVLQQNYRVLLSQAASAAPTKGSDSEQKDMDETTALARTSAGLYTLTFSAAILTAGKVGVAIANNNTLAHITAEVTSTTVVTIKTKLLSSLALADDLLSATELKLTITN